MLFALDDEDGVRRVERSFGEFSGGVAFEFDGVAFETFQIESSAAAREELAFWGARLAHDEGVIATKRDGGGSGITGEHVLARESFQEGVIGELLVRHAREDDVFDARLKRHRDGSDVSGEVGEKFEFLVIERILRVERNFEDVVVIVLHVKSEIVQFNEQAGRLLRNGDDSIAGMFVITDIFLDVVGEASVFLTKVVAFGFGVGFGLAAGGFRIEIALAPGDLVGTEKAIDGVERDDVGQRGAVEIREDDDANFFIGKKREDGTEAIKIATVFDSLVAAIG